MSKMIIEAESFKNLGGWVVDQRSMNVMGSSYVMAHGMGTPVPDATTYVSFSETAKWYAWVRTRDWTAVWKRGTPAGRFKLKVDDEYFDEVLGTNGEKWAWQSAGALEITEGKHKISLCDLTGFNGRCDAIYFTTDENDIPENTEEFRRAAAKVKMTEDEAVYDLVVVGGGIAGVCTALTAIREGIKVALINDRPVLGGCKTARKLRWGSADGLIAGLIRISVMLWIKFRPCSGFPALTRTAFTRMTEKGRPFIPFRRSSATIICSLLTSTWFRLKRRTVKSLPL